VCIGVALALAYNAQQRWASDDSIDHFYALADTALLIVGLALWLRGWVSAFGVVLGALAIQFVVGGIRLIVVGGSYYYLLLGVGLLVCGVLLRVRSKLAGRVYAVLFILTCLWSVWEVGIDMWALMPRVLPLGIIGLAFLAPWIRKSTHPNSPSVFRSPTNRGVAAAVVLGKDRGFLTFAEINDHLPDDVLLKQRLWK